MWSRDFSMWNRDFNMWSQDFSMWSRDFSPGRGRRGRCGPGSGLQG
jgi:hypothetical protein